MKLAIASIALPALLLAAPAGGRAAGPSAQQGGFGAMLLMTADAATFRRAWAGPQPPKLNATTNATRGRPVYAMVIFSGCRAAADGKCRVTAQFSVTKPDGRPYRPSAETKLWGGPPAPARRMQLAESSVGLKLEPKDPPGAYRVRALVTDHVAGISVPVEQAVTAK